MKFNIAVIQFHPLPLSVEANFARMEEYIRKVSSEGADLVVFPEYSVSHVHPDPETGHAPQDASKSQLERFRLLARKYRVDLVPGTILEVDSSDSNCYNVGYYLDRDGNVLGEYKKVNLWHPEREHFESGTTYCPTFDTRFGKVGLLICWDLAFHEGFHKLIEDDVEMVIAPAFWSLEDAGIGMRHNPLSERTFLNALCVTRAFENEVVFVFVNFGDSEQDIALDQVGEAIHSAGCTQIAVPFKGCLKSLPDSKEGYFVQEVDTDILKDAESVYKIRADLKLKEPKFATRK
ncbi:carbon-nitrogen hydrolase [Basidiobolus meristosporus CBS 931.73]|uniref:Carbon-nitrogen hydrolase n=1 Tax=Basidiobolus meristosporus CBS 931.73 TaxID=1314790 RepID=A0A1Y1WU72_9FUNG|nr:carbon-nitrogen hydrolase [Basidiobolus meristosporus CBS 931.73]|eukprot:ORX77063.1 carbon-nitrogen hydrolase [Basidiobolus meristosporus CBS 931.73]